MKVKEFDSAFMVLVGCSDCAFINYPHWHMTLEVCPACGGKLVNVVGKVRIRTEKKFLQRTKKSYTFIPRKENTE